MTYTVLTSRDEDGYWVAYVALLPGVVGQGETEDEAIADVREALIFTLESTKERGEDIPAEPDTKLRELDEAPDVRRRSIELPQVV